MKVLLKQVGKRFKYEWIFRNIDLSFEAPGRYAIQGPNGSGKSTLLRILSGHLTPSKGKIIFLQDDQVLDINQVYQDVSYAAPYIDLVEEFTLKEAIQFHQRFKPLKDHLSADDLIKILGFERSANKPIRFFSSGMKQRLKLALSICSEAKLLLLDEPTTNLDTQGMEWYRGLIDTYTQGQLLIIASNVAVDFDFCEFKVNIQDYKKKKKV